MHFDWLAEQLTIDVQLDASEFFFHSWRDQCLKVGWPICCLFNTLTFWLPFFLPSSKWNGYILIVYVCDYSNHIRITWNQQSGSNTKCARVQHMQCVCLSVCERNVDFVRFYFILFLSSLHDLHRSIEEKTQPIPAKRQKVQHTKCRPKDVTFDLKSSNPLNFACFGSALFCYLQHFSAFFQPQLDRSRLLQSCKSIENLYNVNGIPFNSRMYTQHENWVKIPTSL